MPRKNLMIQTNVLMESRFTDYTDTTIPDTLILLLAKTGGSTKNALYAI